MTSSHQSWAAPGDVNAFFGLMLDNVADLLLTVGLLAAVFGFPTTFAVQHMVPGTAVGVLVGDLMFFAIAVRLTRQLGRPVTAMPLGLDTPSTFGMVFFVLGPAFLAARAAGLSETSAAVHTWHIGICAIFISGLFKLVCAVGSHWIRRHIPRAGLLGSLAAIALVLISFLPLLEILHHPVVGLVALAVILTTLVARVPFPFRVPGALAALLVAGSLYFLMQGLGWLEHAPAAAELEDPADGLLPTGWLEVFRFAWLNALPDTLPYLPIIIPFALATVVGGIDCTESAAAAGDEFDTRQVIGVEAIATVVASLCGGVIQTTPYIGHPAYKAMGGRAAYVLATALFVGGAGILGYFGYLYAVIPKAAVFPILVFIGLEITSQSFLATPRRHYPAVALACVPALAVLGLQFVDRMFGDPALLEAGVTLDSLRDAPLKRDLLTLRVLSNGFIVTSLVWASLLAALIDRRLWRAALFCVAAACLASFGVIHSPLPGGPMFVPWDLDPAVRSVPLRFAAGYAAIAVLLIAWERIARPEPLDDKTEISP